MIQPSSMRMGGKIRAIGFYHNRALRQYCRHLSRTLCIGERKRTRKGYHIPPSDKLLSHFSRAGKAVKHSAHTRKSSYDVHYISVCFSVVYRDGYTESVSKGHLRLKIPHLTVTVSIGIMIIKSDFAKSYALILGIPYKRLYITKRIIHRYRKILRIRGVNSYRGIHIGMAPRPLYRKT